MEEDIDPSLNYLMRGDTLLKIQEDLDKLYAGENIQRGPGIFRRGSGRDGFTLAARSEAGLSPSSPVNIHPLTVYDASSGSVPRIGVTPGAFNGTIIPTIGGVPINTTTGTPALPPYLTLSSGDLFVWFAITYNTFGGAISILINHGTTIPTPSIVVGTAGTDYYGLSSVVVTAGANASVKALNDFVSGPQGYLQCAGVSSTWLK